MEMSRSKRMRRTQTPKTRILVLSKKLSALEASPTMREQARGKGVR